MGRLFSILLFAVRATALLVSMCAKDYVWGGSSVCLEKSIPLCGSVSGIAFKVITKTVRIHYPVSSFLLSHVIGAYHVTDFTSGHLPRCLPITSTSCV